MLFEKTPRELAGESIRAALVERERKPVAQLRAIGENLEAHAAHYGVPVEELVLWIHRTDDLTAATFRRYCIVRAEALEKAKQEWPSG